jgi:hypothetical protein
MALMRGSLGMFGSSPFEDSYAFGFRASGGSQKLKASETDWWAAAGTDGFRDVNDLSWRSSSTAAPPGTDDVAFDDCGDEDRSVFDGELELLDEPLSPRTSLMGQMSRCRLNSNGAQCPPRKRVRVSFVSPTEDSQDNDRNREVEEEGALVPCDDLSLEQQWALDAMTRTCETTPCEVFSRQCRPSRRRLTTDDDSDDEAQQILEPVEDDYDVEQAIASFAAEFPLGSTHKQQQQAVINGQIELKTTQARQLGLYTGAFQNTAIEVRLHYARVREELLQEANELRAKLLLL